jgi:hypothetical protein
VGLIHMCMETTQEISLYNCPYLKLVKMPWFSYFFYVFSSRKSKNKRAEQVLPRGEGQEVDQIMCTHVNKCKNNKIFKNTKL